MTELEIKQNSIQVLGTYYSTAANNTIAYAHQVKDNNLNKFQNTINQDLTDKIEDLVQENQTIRSLIDSINKFSIIVLEDEEELPEIGKENSIYLKKAQDLEGNIYNEYLYVNSKWELVGNTSIDLSNYYTKSEVYNKTEAYSKSEVNDKLRDKLDSTALENYYNKEEVDSKISAAGGGDVVASGNLTSNNLIIGAGPKSIKDSGIPITSLNNTWRPISVGENTLNDTSTTLTINGGDGISVELTEGNLEISNTKEDYVLPTASENSLGGVKTSHVPTKDSELTVQLDAENKAFVNVTSESISNALGYTPINDSSFPAAIPNPYTLNVTANGQIFNYNGSNFVSINLDTYFNNRLPLLTNIDDAGKPGIYFTSSTDPLEVNIRVTKQYPDSIIIVPSNTNVTFSNEGIFFMNGIDSLSGGTYKCYCITWISEESNKDIIFVNGAIYG